MKKLNVKDGPIIYGLGFLALIIIVLIILLLSGVDLFNSAGTPSGKLTVRLDKTSIESGESTSLILQAYNTGTIPMNGKFLVSVDDEEAIKTNYEKPELLSFELFPKESIIRIINVTGTSKAIRTDYQLTVDLIGTNETKLDSKDIQLTVLKKE